MRADDPLLTVRDLSEEPPPITRVVLDPRLTIGAESRLVKTAASATAGAAAAQRTPA